MAFNKHSFGYKVNGGTPTYKTVSKAAAAYERGKFKEGSCAFIKDPGAWYTIFNGEVIAIADLPAVDGTLPTYDNLAAATQAVTDGSFVKNRAAQDLETKRWMTNHNGKVVYLDTLIESSECPKNECPKKAPCYKNSEEVQAALGGRNLAEGEGEREIGRSDCFYYMAEDETTIPLKIGVEGWQYICEYGQDNKFINVNTTLNKVLTRFNDDEIHSDGNCVYDIDDDNNTDELQNLDRPLNPDAWYITFNNNYYRISDFYANLIEDVEQKILSEHDMYNTEVVYCINTEDGSLTPYTLFDGDLYSIEDLKDYIYKLESKLVNFSKND